MTYEVCSSDIEIPETTNILEISDFITCAGVLKSLTVSSNIATIENNIFDSKTFRIKYLILMKGLKILGNSMFYNSDIVDLGIIY
jgi:hypothetical protein